MNVFARLIIVSSGAHHICAVHLGVWPKERPRSEADCHSSHIVLTLFGETLDGLYETDRGKNLLTNSSKRNRLKNRRNAIILLPWQLLQVSQFNAKSSVQCKLTSTVRLEWSRLIAGCANRGHRTLTLAFCACQRLYFVYRYISFEGNFLFSFSPAEICASTLPLLHELRALENHNNIKAPLHFLKKLTKKKQDFY